MLKTLIRSMLLFCCSLIFGCLAVVAKEAVPIPGAQIVTTEFQSVVEQLQTQPVPVVLPTELPFPVYPDLRLTNAEGYEISLDHTPDCHGAGYCSDGILQGKLINQSTPSIAAQYAFETQPNFQPIARSAESMGQVDLARGIRGYFIPYVCGANCDSSKVIWDQGGYRYTVGIRSGAKAVVLTLANSAIENEK